MGLVDIEYDVYRCPHCEGVIVVRKQYPHFDMGCSVSVEHLEEVPDYLVNEEIHELGGKE